MRKWTEVISPKLVHDELGLYKGSWMPDMDRCWISDDGYSVTSRLLMTEWGKVEHATIEKRGGMTAGGEKDIPWKVKQEIKNELFGGKRTAIEVFPPEDRLVDACDIYHLWIFDKHFGMPFGIHPKDKECRVINRGCSVNKNNITQKSAAIYSISGGNKG